METTERSPGRDWTDVGLTALLLLAAGLLFWPLARAIGLGTLQEEQLRNAFIVTCAAVVAVGLQYRAQLRPAWNLDRTALVLVVAAMALATLAGGLRSPVLLLPGLLCFVAAGLRTVFGTTSGPLVRAAVVGLGGFVLLFLAMPVLDWPLRSVAGYYSGAFLHHLGLAPQLLLVRGAGEPELLLRIGAHTFIVAKECNGFGLLSSSLLLAVVLVQVSPASLAWRIACVPLAGLSGLVFNLLRILAITLIAPHFPGRESYDFIHETAGIAALWGGLAAVWFLCRWGRR